MTPHKRCRTGDKSVRWIGTVACLTILLSVIHADAAAAFAGEIGDGEAIFLPEGMTPDRLPVPLALLKTPQARGPLPTGWTLRPVLSQSGEGKDFKSRVTLSLPDNISLYGEGEVMGPLLRNGTHTILWNTDNGSYRKDRGQRLYQSHPWVMGVRPDGSAFGFLADTTWHSEIDLSHGIDFSSDGPPFPVIVVERSSPQELMRALGELIGTAPLPPRWALGYHQCRYSYVPDARVREIADTFRAKKIPCDVIWMDIDYMDGYRVFTFDPKGFPDPDATNRYLHDRSFHSVWMIDPGVKTEKGYAVSDSGDAAGIWVKDKNGADYVGRVWPGPCKFVDYTTTAGRNWWAGLYKDFMARGVDGVWNDMNEPAVFASPDATMPLDNRHAGGDGGLPPGTEAQYHNVFGMLEVRASRQGIQAANPDKRPFVLSRAGFLGSQRYGATWTGDNSSTWEHLKVSIPMSLSLGLAGQPFNGPDCGGFGGAATPELWANWVAVDALFPFCRGHASKGTPAKEPWAFGEETERAARTALERRYRLLPYLYTLFDESSRDGLPVMRPVFFADPKDESLRAEERAFLVGGDVLVIPRWAERPALPQGVWRSVSLLDGDAEKDAYQPELRVRGGAIVPLGKVVQSTAEESFDPLTLLVCLGADGTAEGTLYEDAGEGYGAFRRTTYRAQKSGGEVTVSIAKSDGAMTPKAYPIAVEVLTDKGVVRAAGSREIPIRVKLTD